MTAVDIDPLQPVLDAAPADQGPFGKAGGSEELVHGRFPADPKAVAAVGGGYDLFLSKNSSRGATSTRRRRWTRGGSWTWGPTTRLS